MRKGVFAPNTAEDALQSIIFMHAVGCAPSIADGAKPSHNDELIKGFQACPNIIGINLIIGISNAFRYYGNSLSQKRFDVITQIIFKENRVNLFLDRILLEGERARGAEEPDIRSVKCAGEIAYKRDGVPEGWGQFRITPTCKREASLLPAI